MPQKSGEDNGNGSHPRPHWRGVPATLKLDIEAFAFYKYKWELESIVERVKLLKKLDLPTVQRDRELEKLDDEIDNHKWLKVRLDKIEEEISNY